MKKAFTIIELIFVIVLIGILAVIAIPKLSGTRDDAKKVVELNNISNCIQDIASAYTSKGVEDNDTSSCSQVKCAVIDLGNINDGNVTVTLKDSSDGYPNFCDYAKTMAQRKQLDGNHSFSGLKVQL